MYSKGGLLMPQQFVFTLTARPGTLRLKPRTGGGAAGGVRLPRLLIIPDAPFSLRRITADG